VEISGRKQDNFAGMKQDEISELAKTTCAWLAYKSLTGFEEIFLEAMLSLPIPEFLASRKDWLLDQEVDYRGLPNAAKLPRIWCDFGGKRRFGKQEIDFLLETKFLKQAAKNAAKDIAADVIRLSLPPQKPSTRIFLLAGNSEYFPKTDEAFLFSRMFSLERKKGCNLRPADAILVPGFAKTFPAVAETIEKTYAPRAIYVHCRAIVELPGICDTKYKVGAWTVARTT
jgi:hypothetical protein